MDNKEIIQILDEIALLLELKGENPFKSKAYINAARAIELLDGNISDYAAEGRLNEISGIGKAISEKLSELIDTGQLEYYNKLRASIPEGLFDILKIPGLGPKKVKIVFEQLGVQNIEELECACIEDKVANLEGFGERTQNNILKGISQIKGNKREE